jgi:hypothetical protein
MLAEVDRPFTLRAEDVARKPDRHCPGRRSETPPLEFGAKVEQSDVAALE